MGIVKLPALLVADDDPELLNLLSRRLTPLAERVIEASDGESAWRAVQRERPSIVILDVMMPGLTGWEVCRRIRETKGLESTRVVMLTGIGERLNEMTSPLYGADAFIDKPFEFGDLEKQLRAVASGQR